MNSKKCLNLSEKRHIAIITMSLLMILCGVLAAMDLIWGGPYHYNAIRELSPSIIPSIRLPRMITALLSGAALALGGLQMQSIFRNPLADPHIMGVSAGAGLGAALATMSSGFLAAGLPSIYANGYLQAISGCLGIVGASFIGAIICSALILAVSSKTSSSSTLLIFGIMLGFITNAVIAIIQYASSADSLKLYCNWAAGSFSNAGVEGIICISASLVIALALATKNAKGLDIILFGEEYAGAAGASAGGIQIISLLSCCLIAASVTAFCGPIGFAGIAAPHIARKLTRTSLHRHLIPASMLTGACLGVGADLLSQIWSRPIPSGSVMALIGIPVVLMILVSGHKKSIK